MALNMTKGLIPLDFIEDDIIDVSKRIQTNDCRGYDNLGWRPEVPEFLVIHKAQSEDEPGVTLGSPTGYFTQRCCPALTDLEINPRTGRMRRFVKRGNAPSGWANGKVSDPYGDALKYLDHYGWDYNRVNRNGEACEILGWFPTYPVTQDTTVDEVAIERLVRWMASRAHDYGIPWDQFPIIPSENNRSYITWHTEWTAGTGKICPGPWVMSHTSEWIERAKNLMKAYQTAGQDQTPAEPTPPVYTEPMTLSLEWWGRHLQSARPSDAMVDGVRWFAIRRREEAVRNANRYSQPDTSSPKSGPKILVREKIGIERWFKDASGRAWFVEDAGHFVPANAFTPAVSIKPR
jgi:hypothetical protein